MSRFSLSKPSLLLIAAVLIFTGLTGNADARQRSRYVVHAAPAYATDFWGRCFVRRYSVWWLQMCPAQRLAVARGYVRPF